jgi:hypothetical protein
MQNPLALEGEVRGRNGKGKGMGKNNRRCFDFGRCGDLRST